MRRRDFIKSAALAGAAPGLAPPRRMARAASNDRLQDDLGRVEINPPTCGPAALLLVLVPRVIPLQLFDKLIQRLLYYS